MEYFVMRVCDGGRRVEKHVRLAGRTRGVITIRQESDATRHRALLVARLVPTVSQRPIPPLFDATLIGSSGESWFIAGYERIEAGPLQHQYSVAQTWIIEPASVQDLIDAEAKWAAANQAASDLRSKLQALGQGNAPATGSASAG